MLAIPIVRVVVDDHGVVLEKPTITYADGRMYPIEGVTAVTATLGVKDLTTVTFTIVARLATEVREREVKT
jgi:hypothetical protein